MGFSVTVPHKAFKFGMCIHKTQMEGSVSQIFDLGPNVGIYIEKNKEKLPVF